MKRALCDERTKGPFLLGGPVRRAPLLVLAILGLAGSAVALPVEGTLTAAGPFTLPPGSMLTTTPLAILQNDTAAMPWLAFSFPQARLTLYELRFVNVGGTLVPTSIQPREDVRPLNAATATLGVGEKAGFIGVYPKKGQLTVMTTESAEVTPSNHSTLAWGDWVGGADKPESFRYT